MHIPHQRLAWRDLKTECVCGCGAPILKGDPVKVVAYDWNGDGTALELMAWHVACKRLAEAGDFLEDAECPDGQHGQTVDLQIVASYEGFWVFWRAVAKAGLLDDPTWQRIAMGFAETARDCAHGLELVPEDHPAPTTWAELVALAAQIEACQAERGI